MNAKIFQGLGPKRRESSNGDRGYAIWVEWYSEVGGGVRLGPWPECFAQLYGSNAELC